MFASCFLKRRLLLSVCLSLISLSSNAADTLRVYAASSMTNAVSSLVEQFQYQHKVNVVTVFGGTSSLARQIEHGAPVDIYIAANRKWVEYLIHQQIVKGDNVTNLASNRLVVISKQRKLALDVTQTQDWLSILGEGERLAIGDPSSVPAGMYAKQSLQTLGVWTSLEASLAPTNNVRVALTLTERGEVPLGIVYQTDALQSDDVAIIAELPENSHEQIVYPMVQLTHQPSSALFANFVNSAQGQQILAQYGFISPKESL
ncbi:molybdate ABC transporter substrate-binding protein [Vibrio sp. JPW-9-11-11]|uniref:molybdate ABC transporter substrate-binding protein n=1 Tax=Vibrio sp. JPW-9-11-11 TaxID=1416532 RepID=UPI0015930765|nr:molybdate ABC transporter substrate-binding protein [Vibrio sp. JPW-9-11-11]NVD07881.1 molybdate ABC transporter substrate-binding protein [Vibrio sp. JPW-9-11-11]